MEQAALTQLLARKELMVLATGGGIVSEPLTFDLILSSFYTIWLKAEPEEHMARVRGQGDLRPMADDRSAMAELRNILVSREPLYARGLRGGGYRGAVSVDAAAARLYGRGDAGAGTRGASLRPAQRGVIILRHPICTSRAPSIRSISMSHYDKHATQAGILARRHNIDSYHRDAFVLAALLFRYDITQYEQRVPFRARPPPANRRSRGSTAPRPSRSTCDLEVRSCLRQARPQRRTNPTIARG